MKTKTTTSIYEIAPLPLIHNPQQRMKAKENLKYFCEQYFPQSFSLAWSNHQLKIIELLQTTLIQGGDFDLEMPYRIGKTTLITTATIWAALYGHCRFIKIVGNDKYDTDVFIKCIKHQLTYNKNLLEDFPEAIYPFHKLCNNPSWARKQLYLGELTKIEYKSDIIIFPEIPESPSSGTVIITNRINHLEKSHTIVFSDGTIKRPDTILFEDNSSLDNSRITCHTFKLQNYQ
ncbi:MAG: hypothetical protein LBL62_11915 [Planctomycetaceae bacterium]|jgi:hypothetical protein|nr:hypothetical protein [Planctomycetaceae bacterium]